MNRIIAGLMAAGAIVSAAPSAHADTDSYLADLASTGIRVPAANAMVAGQLVCHAVADGISPRDLINGIASGPNALPATEAVTIVAAALGDLCPQYLGAPSQSSAPGQRVPVTIAGSVMA